MRGRQVGVIFMVLILTLGSVGVGFGLWSKSLMVLGTVNTGNVNARFLAPFTDDDNKVDDELLDSGDIGTCREGEDTSCDPAASGPDPKPRYNKDVAVCIATRPTADEDPDQAPGIQLGFVELRNAYPSYYCTAWFPINNNGTIPVKVMRIDITDGAGNIIISNAIPSRIYNLNLFGDERVELALHITDIRLLEQIDPGQSTLMNLDMHVLQPAPQNETFMFDVHVVLGQWNEVGGCLGATHDICIDTDGFTTPGDGIPWAAEIRVGDTLTAFSREGPPDNRSGVDMFDQDDSGSWTVGDDLHTEAPVYGGIRDAHHRAQDPVILDLNGDLALDLHVDCDLDTGTYCKDPNYGVSIDHTLFMFLDWNGDGYWDNGEDIVLDVNGNGIFD
ncbi:MAG: hypothetical protein PVI78_10440 [Anaerolineales bacterium]